MLELAAKFKQRTDEIIGATFVLIKAKQAIALGIARGAQGIVDPRRGVFDDI